MPANECSGDHDRRVEVPAATSVPKSSRGGRSAGLSALTEGAGLSSSGSTAAAGSGNSTGCDRSMFTATGGFDGFLATLAVNNGAASGASALSPGVASWVSGKVAVAVRAGLTASAVPAWTLTMPSSEKTQTLPAARRAAVNFMPEYVSLLLMRVLNSQPDYFNRYSITGSGFWMRTQVTILTVWRFKKREPIQADPRVQAGAAGRILLRGCALNLCAATVQTRMLAPANANAGGLRPGKPLQWRRWKTGVIVVPVLLLAPSGRPARDRRVIHQA